MLKRVSPMLMPQFNSSTRCTSSWYTRLNIHGDVIEPCLTPCSTLNRLPSEPLRRTVAYIELLLIESLHDSRTMLGAGSSSGWNSSRSSWVHGCGRMGQTGRCFIVCSSPHSHVVCSSSLNPHFCIRDLHRPVPLRRRFRLDQVGHASLEPGGSDSLGLNESLCGVVWRWLDQRFSIRVRALPSRGSTEWRKLCLDFSLFLTGSCSSRKLHRISSQFHFL